MEIPRGFVLDDGTTSRREREDRIIRERNPELSPEALSHPVVRAICLEKAQEGSRKLPDSGQLIYRRYKNEDTGEIRHIPEGDSGCWLPKATGFKGHFGRLKFIDGQPRIASTLQSRTVYE